MIGQLSVNFTLVYHEIPGSNHTKGISFYKKTKENLRKLGKTMKSWDSGGNFRIDTPNVEGFKNCTNLHNYLFSRCLVFGILVVS